MPAVKVPKASLWRAIRNKCLDCIGEDAGSKWAVGNCECRDCPLHGVRPYQHLLNTPPQGVYILDQEA